MVKAISDIDQGRMEPDTDGEQTHRRDRNPAFRPTGQTRASVLQWAYKVGPLSPVRWEDNGGSMGH